MEKLIKPFWGGASGDYKRWHEAGQNCPDGCQDDARQQGAIALDAPAEPVVVAAPAVSRKPRG